MAVVYHGSQLLVASKQIFFSPSIKKCSYFIFFRQELMSLFSIFTVPRDNSNGLKDKMKPRTTVKKLHRKKRFTSFPSPAGMSLAKLPLGRNNSVMTSLFPPRESLVVTSRLGTGTREPFFTV
jgi:hypothetical protein